MSFSDEILWARHMAMRASDRPDDTIFMQLTENETCLITYALLMIAATDKPLKEACKVLGNKLADLIEEQKNV